MSDDEEAKGVDYLARTVLQSRAKIDPIGFIRFKPQPKPKPASKPRSSARQVKRTK